MRDAPGKVVRGDIRFARKKQLGPTLVAEHIVIENPHGWALEMNLRFNEKTGEKNINVHIPGIGAICRLDVDSQEHRSVGRNHKHSLQTERCPDRGLPDGVLSRPELAGKSAAAVFTAFCALANIAHEGSFEAPEPSGGAA